MEVWHNGKNHWYARLYVKGKRVFLGTFKSEAEAVAAWEKAAAEHGDDRFLGRGPKARPAEERFWELIDRSGSCWLWKGYLNEEGYGRFTDEDGELWLVHKWAFTRFRFPIPSGFELDHLCHTNDPNCSGGSTCLHRRCVRPDHLEPVTKVENAVRAGKRRTKCKRGHELTLENLYLNHRRDRPVERMCKICRREYMKSRAT